MTSGPVGPARDIPAEFSEIAAAISAQYQLQSELGRGGMGVVFLARDLRLDRLVAIKMLLPHIANDEKVRERFLREARTAASLAHPNVVPIHRADEIAGHAFFVMGYVHGASLAGHVRARGPLPPIEVAGYLEDVAGALHAAHLRGIVHRDVKAENILIDESARRAMVTDFGIARVAQGAPLTATGAVLGTVHYMSPEQVLGEGLDARSDIYSLGVVAYYAMSGRFPFEHESPSAIVVAHVTKPPTPLIDMAPGVPRQLATLVDRCLEKNPANRFASSEALLRSLQQLDFQDDDWAEDTNELREPAALPDLEDPPSGLFSETQAQAVWDRAARMQANMDPGETPSPRSLPVSETSGYRADVVRDAGREAGIGTGYVDKALADVALSSRGVATIPGGGQASTTPAHGEVVRDNTGGANPWAGEAKMIEFEASLDGELPERDFDTVIEAVRRALGDVGVVSGVGRSMSWSSSDPQRKIQVSVQARDGRTNIRVGERLSSLAGGVFGGVIGGGGGALGGSSIGAVMGATGNPVFAFTAAAGIVGLSYGVARVIYIQVVRRRKRQLSDLTSKITADVRAVIDRRAAAQGRLRGNSMARRRER
ncbi:MAG TPA: serine/threonine-protein kinase [Gemmatimonadaceae bacterium]|nr:serine/threonine-protein kinase [Gemmatimonadaceae bacterium]